MAEAKQVPGIIMIKNNKVKRLSPEDLPASIKIMSRDGSKELTATLSEDLTIRTYDAEGKLQETFPHDTTVSHVRFFGKGQKVQVWALFADVSTDVDVAANAFIIDAANQIHTIKLHQMVRKTTEMKC